MADPQSDETPDRETARYREFVADSNEPEERQTLANQALDTYEVLANRDDIQTEDLEPIVIAAQHPHKFVWDIGTVFLVKLAVSHDAARDAIVELAGHNKADVRDSIIWALKWAWKDGLPRDLVLQVLRGAFSDRVKKVRQQAIKVADMLRMEELVSDLNDLLQTENNEDVRKTLRFHIAMMTDGYLLAYNDRNEPRLTVRTKNGWGGSSITQQQIDEGKLPDIVREMQSKDYY
jgi:hypothetical protein